MLTHEKILHLIIRNGYKYPDPWSYPKTVDGLDRYLKQAGVKHFSGKELATPYHPDIARKQGYPDGTMIPPQSAWPHGLACITIAEEIRKRIGAPLLCANWFRADGYNAAVGGAPGGDHPGATAIDIQFIGDDREVERQRAIALRYLEELYKTGDYLALGLYKDRRRIHIGVYTAAGHRRWG